MNCKHCYRKKRNREKTDDNDLSPDDISSPDGIEDEYSLSDNDALSDDCEISESSSDFSDTVNVNFAQPVRQYHPVR